MKSRMALLAILGVAALSACSTGGDINAIETANKKVVTDFYAALDAADAKGTTGKEIKDIAETYLSPDYKQNSEAFKSLPGTGSDRDKLIALFQTMPPRNPPPPKPETVSVMAEGDLVTLLTSRNLAASGEAPKKLFIFNMFRVKDGKLVEHWDGSAPPPPKPQ